MTWTGWAPSSGWSLALQLRTAQAALQPEDAARPEDRRPPLPGPRRPEFRTDGRLPGQVEVSAYYVVAEALGGRIILHSLPGAGTTLRAKLPLTVTGTIITTPATASSLPAGQLGVTRSRGSLRRLQGLHHSPFGGTHIISERTGCRKSRRRWPFPLRCR